MIKSRQIGDFADATKPRSDVLLEYRQAIIALQHVVHEMREEMQRSRGERTAQAAPTPAAALREIDSEKCLV